MGISVRNVTKRFGDFVAARQRQRRGPARRAGRAARPVRLRQDDAAAHHRRARDGRQRLDPLRRGGRHRPLAARPQRRLRLPALRALPPHDACSRTSPSACACGSGSAPTIDAARPRAAAPDPARGPRQPGARRSSPAASASASRWRARSRRRRRCCCSTSRSARSTPRCARSCASGCAACTTRSTSPACSSPTIRKKRSRSPTASWS